MGEIMRGLLKKEEALRLAKEVENIKLNTDININTEDMAKLVSSQYKKAHSLVDQNKGNKHSKTNNDSITDTEDIDNGEVYDINTGITTRDL